MPTISARPRRASQLPKRVFRHADLGRRFQRLRTSALSLLLVLSAAAVLSVQAGAQVRFGSVLGSVTDTSGASLSEANVKITNLGTNETRTAKTTSAGTYSFPNLNAGIYRLEVEVAGFKRFTQERVEVQVDLATRVDASM